MWYTTLGLFISTLILSTQGLPLENTLTTTANPPTTPSLPVAPTISNVSSASLVEKSTSTPTGKPSLTPTIGNPLVTTPAVKTAYSSVEKPGAPSVTEKSTTSAPPKETATLPVEKILVTTEKPQATKTEAHNATTLKIPTSSSEPTFKTGGNQVTEKPHKSCCSVKTTEIKPPTETIPPAEGSNDGRIIVFSGICGPDGCKLKGDVYDEFPPLLSK